MEEERKDAATSPGTPGVPNAGRGREDPSLEPQEGVQPDDTLISDVWSPEPWENQLQLI